VHGPGDLAPLRTDIWHSSMTEAHLKGKGFFSLNFLFPPRFSSCEENCKCLISKNMIFHEFARIVT